MIISIDAEEVFKKIQNSFMIKKKKTLQKMGTEGTYVNITKAIYDKHTANIILKDEKLISIPSKIRNKTRVPTLTTIIQYNMFSNSWLWLLEKKKKEKRSRLEKK